MLSTINDFAIKWETCARAFLFLLSLLFLAPSIRFYS